MMVEERLPALRKDIQVFPAILQGRRVYVVSDPLGLLKEPLVMLEENASLLRLFDGNHTLRDLQVEMMYARGNRLIMREEAEDFVRELRKNLLLETDEFRDALEKEMEEFASLPMRPLFHAGKGYPGDVEGARAFLDRVFEEAGPADGPRGDVAAVVVPHIDLQVGARTYAKGYSALRKGAFDSVLLLCTGHYLGGELFCLTDKDFATPFGVVKTDKEAVYFLSRGKSRSISGSDFPHKVEHSIEFQLLFLSYLFPIEEFRVVPVLCGSFDKFLGLSERPTLVPAVKLFVSRLKRLLSEGGRKWLIVAGVDLSHVGPKFGHQDPAKFMESQFGAHDEVILTCIRTGDPSGLFNEVKKVNNRYNVCGFSSLLVLLELLEGSRGEVLDYSIWFDNPTLSAVSYASAVIYR